MIALFMVGMFLLYVFLASLLINYNFHKRKSKKGGTATLIFVILLPTWDVLIAFLIYMPASVFWSGNTINSHISTDTIYFDIFYENNGIGRNRTSDYFKNGVNVIEMYVSEIHPYPCTEEKGKFRFWLDSTGNLQCKKIKEFESRYVLRFSSPFKVPLIPIEFSSKRIIDRHDNSIVASSNNVSVYYWGLVGKMLPFSKYISSDNISSNQEPFDIENLVINKK